MSFNNLLHFYTILRRIYFVLYVADKTFVNEEILIKLPSGQGNTVLDFQNNYWNTKSSIVIDSIIYDFYDDPDFNTYIANYEPFLLAPNDELPGSPLDILGVYEASVSRQK